MPLPERELISRIRNVSGFLRPSRGRPVVVGIGDDASVLDMPKNHEVLVTTDFSLEGIHFRREWHPPESVGHRCLARGLSDIAAMGGEPVAAFLSLALPASIPQAWVDRFIEGVLKLSKKYKVKIAGGDTAESPDGVLADIIVIGSVPKGQALLRSGARPGDRLYVTGQLGGSAAALNELLSARKRKLRPTGYPRHFAPEPRISVGRILREKKIATSMIDLSDGLSTDLSHICEESDCGAVIWKEAILCARVGKRSQEVDIELALHGGEDYELLFTASRKTRVPSRLAGVQVTEIGYMTRGPRTVLESGHSSEPFKPRGWEHFRS